MTIELARTGDRVHLTVRDNGHGFSANGSGNGPTGLGLVGMRARAQSIGGELRIDSTDGVAIGLWAPLEGARN